MGRGHDVRKEEKGMDDVRDRVAFVTGGASGIGLGIARALLGAGAKVVDRGPQARPSRRGQDRACRL